MNYLTKRKSFIIKELIQYFLLAGVFLYAGIILILDKVNTNMDLSALHILGILMIFGSIFILCLSLSISTVLIHDGKSLYKKNLLNRQMEICKLSETEILDLSKNIKSQPVSLGTVAVNPKESGVYLLKYPKGHFLIHKKNYSGVTEFIQSLAAYI